MFWRFRVRRERAEVLAALALVARRGEPLGEGFARLAAHDALLSPWTARLLPALRAELDDASIGGVLVRHSLATPAEAELIDRAEGDGRGAEALQVVAERTRRPVRGRWLIEWLPVWLVLLPALPILLAQIMVRLGWMAHLEKTFTDLGVMLPPITQIMVRPQRLELLGVVILVLMGVTAAVVFGLGRIPKVGFLGAFWAPSLLRNLALLDLVRAARWEEDTPGELHHESRSWRDSPHWWNRWYSLSFWRLDRQTRIRLREAPGIGDRLRIMGWLPPDRSPTAGDWVAVEDSLLAAVVPRLEFLVRFLLCVSVMFIYGFFVMALFAPLARFVVILGM